MNARACLVAVAACACSSAPAPSPPQGHIVVAITIDWEGAELSAPGLAALAELRTKLGAVPITHFVSAAYLTSDAAARAATIASAIRPGDELAMHLHAWRSLAQASGITPRLSPSFLTGTDQLLEIADGGFDTDLDTYDVAGLRALLRTSRRLLEQTRIPVSRSFRAGGYLATPKVISAIAAEGYTVNSSAIDRHQLDELEDAVLSDRLAGVWPRIEATSQPYVLREPLLEMPIAAVTDYVEADEIVRMFEAAHARLAAEPSRDVFVVLASHLETADDNAARLGDAITTVRDRRSIADKLLYSTIDQAAELARFPAKGGPSG